MPMIKDRRKHLRVAVDWPAVILKGDRAREADLTNISATGAFLRSDKPLRPKERFRLFILANRHSPLTVNFEVAWVRVDYTKDKMSPCSMGIRFTRVSSADRQFLRNVIAKHYEGKPSPIWPTRVKKATPTISGRILSTPRRAIQYSKNTAELRLRFFVVIYTYLFRTVFRYESRLRIPFCISTRWSVPLHSPQRQKNTIPDDTAMQNNYLIYHVNQYRIPTSSILGFFSFLIGTSLVSSLVWDSSLTGAQELPSQQDLN